MFTSIAGRKVVVTGGSRGIGRGIARVFAGAGARVLVVGRDRSALAETAESVTDAGGEVSTMIADVSGSTADIGYAALFFASDGAGYITGQTLVVDGGQVLPESRQALDEM